MPPLYPYELHYLASQLNMENLGQIDLRETFQVTAPASQIPEVLRIGPIVVADLPYTGRPNWRPDLLTSDKPAQGAKPTCR